MRDDRSPRPRWTRLAAIASLAVGAMLAGAAGAVTASSFVDVANDHPFVDEDEPLWAVVEADGTLARGNRVVTTGPLSGDGYEVIFDRPVDGCSYQATLGNSDLGEPAAGSIGVAPRLTGPNGVYVITYDDTGAVTQRSFHLNVVCTP